MVSVTYADLHALLHITVADISAINTEKILDLAIDCLNLYGQLDMSNMAGTAGSKTLNVTSQEKAAIFLVARTIYYSFYIGLTSANINSLGVTNPPDLLSNSIIQESVREAARLLQESDYSRAFLRS
jgi:hypothetical protein